MRRHGWQHPVNPLQILEMAVFLVLVAVFYVLLGPLLGSKILENAVLTLFTFIAISVAFLFVRCTAIDPTDRTNSRNKRGRGGMSRFNYKYIFYQVVSRFIRKLESKILKCCIRRRYTDQWKGGVQLEPLLPFPILVANDVVEPCKKVDDTMFCSLCDFEVKVNSKHCRSCDRCVEGFDHHCRWLNNCIGRRNYTTFILLLVFVLLMLLVEGGSAVAIFIRCFAGREGIAYEMRHKIHLKWPRGVLASISGILAIFALYTLAALGQLFFFHVVLIRKGMRTYDYILAMREESQLADPFEDLDLSSDDESFDLDSPEKSKFSRFLCRRNVMPQGIQNLCNTERDYNPSSSDRKAEVHIDPWKLLKMSKERATMAAERARERIRQKFTPSKAFKPVSPLKPLPSENKQGPLMNPEIKEEPVASTVTKSWIAGPSSGGMFSSPKRRFSGSSSPRQPKYRSNFDLKLTEVSREMETYISRQVLCSVLQSGSEAAASPR